MRYEECKRYLFCKIVKYPMCYDVRCPIYRIDGKPKSCARALQMRLRKARWEYVAKRLTESTAGCKDSSDTKS